MMRGYLVGVAIACVACGSTKPARAPAANEHPGALVDHAIEEGAAGKLDDAERDLQHAAELGAPDGWGALARLRVYRGNLAGADEAFARDQSGDPLARAWMLFAEGKLAEALAADEAALPGVGKAPDPEQYVKAPMLRGGLLLELGRYREAIDALTTAQARVAEAALGDDPYFRCVPLALLAWAQLRAGDAAGDESLAKLEALGAANDGDRILGLMLPIVRGERAIAHGDLAAAEQALAACPAFAICLYQLADVQAQRGEAESAQATRAKIGGLFSLSPPELFYRRRAMH